MENDSTPQPQDSHFALDRIYKEAPVGLCVFDTDLRYVYINAWLAALNGISEEDHLGRTVGEVLPDLAKSIEPQLQKVIDTGQPVVEGTAFGSTMARSGDKRHFQHTYQPIMSSDGSITGINCMVLDVTERTGAVNSPKFTQFAIDRAVDPAFFIREDGSFFYVNEAACCTLGYSREELLSLGVPDITLDYPRGTWTDRWREMRDGRNITFEGHHRTKDGRVFPVEITANLLEYDGVAYNCAFARDITERKHAEEAQSRLTAILEATPDFVAYASPNEDVIYVNKAGREMVGVGLDVDIAGLKISDFHPAWAYEILTRECIPKAIRDGAWTGEAAFLHRDGHEIPVSMVILSHKTPDGDVKYLSTISRDITERKEAEVAIRQSEERFHSVAQSANDAIVLSNDRGNILFWNPSAEATFGYTAEEILGQPLTILMPERYQDAHRRGLERFCATGEGRVAGTRIELHGRRRDGTEFPMELSLSTWRTDQGLFFSGILRDITERRRAEEELRESERKLRQAVEERERLSRNLHDGILQSLYAIGLGLEICPPALENYPNNGCPHINQLNAVMREVRSFISGIERFIETDNFEDAITSMVASMTSAYSTHVDVRLDLDIVKTLPHTQAMDFLYITREALSNSLQHAKASQGVVSLRGEGDRVILEVSDDGQGFDPHHLVGRGRGLNNIRARARHLGGRLHVQSEPSQGTQIILDLPQ